MRIGDLEKEGIPARIIDIWRRRQGESLLPVQSRAIRRGLLNTQTSHVSQVSQTSQVRMIISAPTSSGKSFCAELAAVRALTSREKVILLFPLKSLAEEKYRLLEDTFHPLGIETLLLTGDHPENDSRFLSGHFNMAVGIYEKIDILTTARMDSLANVGLVVVDELQMIAEPGRGAILERLLTRILASCYNPGLLALSAVLGDKSGRRLAEWLEAELVEEEGRPVELLRGVAAEGQYRFLAYNSGEDGSEPFESPQPGESLITGFLTQMRESSDSVIVFLKSRQETVALAMQLAASVEWPAAKNAIEKLGHEEPSYLVRSLRQVLGKGIAFHNSDLSSSQRSIIEQGFISKEIRALFSTTTLAMGVNLPADTVYLETVKYSSGVYGDRPTLGPITTAEFDNMSGRAGRLGHADNRPGRAIVLADSIFDSDILWDTYIAPTSEHRIDSAFCTLPLEDWLLNLIVAGLGDTVDALKAVLDRSYWAMQGDVSGLALSASIEWLRRTGFLVSEDRSTEASAATATIAPTSFGSATVLSGLSVKSADYFRGQLNNGQPETTFGWIALALSAPDWSLPASLLTRHEQRENLPVKMLYQRFDYSVEEVHYLLPENHRRTPLAYRAAASLKAALLLDDWRQLVPLQQMEERYQVHLGQIQSMGDMAAHLTSALASIIEASDGEAPSSDTLHQLSFSLKHGLPLEFMEIHECLGEILTRSDLLKLQQAGVECMGEFSDMSDSEREKIINNISKSKSINDKLRKLKEEVSVNNSSVAALTISDTAPESIEIDGSSCGERFLVKINGFPVTLTGKSFKYFVKLAWSRLRGESGWLYKEDIEVGFNQARYLYRMKNEIASSLQNNWPVIENNRLGYYRLNAKPDRIHVNYENLRNHPDYEIRQLVEALGGDGMAH